MSGNEPAFPHAEYEGRAEIETGHTELVTFMAQPGLTKRELFAAMAMQGVVGDYESMRMFQAKASASNRTISEQLAIVSCHAADALIAELAKGAP